MTIFSHLQAPSGTHICFRNGENKFHDRWSMKKLFRTQIEREQQKSRPLASAATARLALPLCYHRRPSLNAELLFFTIALRCSTAWYVRVLATGNCFLSTPWSILTWAWQEIKDCLEYIGPWWRHRSTFLVTAKEKELRIKQEVSRV